MITSWLFVAAAVLGQVQTTQPAEEPPGLTVEQPANAEAQAPADPERRPGGSAIRVRVVPPATQPTAGQEPSPDEIAVPALPTTLPEGFVGLTGGPVGIQVTDTGIVITAEDPRDIAYLQGLIEMMDRQPPVGFQFFPLENATAQTIATTLQDIWQKAKAGVTGRVSPEDRLTVVAEPRANMLMVAAAQQNMEEIETIIKQLDRPSLVGRIDITPIPLQHIKAVEAQTRIQEMLKTLQQQYKIDRELLNISADARTNSLLVTAPKSDLEVVRRLVEIIDVPPTLEGGGVAKVAIFPLQKAVARDLADSLTEMLKADTPAGEALEEQIRRLQVTLRKAGGGETELTELNLEKPINIIPEEGTNSIVVQTTEGNLQAIGEIIHVLDSVPLADEMMVKMFPLKFADAETLRSNLDGLFTAGKNLPEQPGKSVPGRIPPGLPGAALAYNVALSADPRTNTLIVAGRPEQVYLATQIVTSVDVAEHANRFAPRLIKLENASVERMQQAVEQLADLREQMAERLSPTEQARERILVIPDERTNSLIILANDENFQEIQELAAKLDTPEDKWLGEIHIINLQDPLAATDVADKIENLWERRAEQRREGGLPEDMPRIVADTRSNALIIASNKEDYQAISNLVKQLQQLPLSPMQDIRQVVLKYNSAPELAQLITQLFEERLQNSLAEGAQEEPADRVFVSADPVTNTMLVVSSKATYEEIIRLVNQLDVPPAVEGTLKTFYVKNADVTQAAEMIRELFDEGIFRGPGPQEVPESQQEVTIIPDVRSSALIVSASPENLSIIESVLKDIDRVDVPVFQADAKFIPIRNADVVNVASKLEDMFEGIRTAMGDQGEQFELQIIPNTRTNTLILAGSRLAMRRAEELIPLLDQPLETAAYETKVYKLQQGAASRLAPLLEDLFERRTTEEQAGERTPVTIIPDPASNTLIISASRDDHADITRLLERLDIPSQLAQQMQVISLEKAKATAVAETLQDLVEAQQGEQETAFSVTADERTNSLVVFAPPDLMTTVQDIVRRLDRAEPGSVLAMRVFRLENANAENLSELLNEFFEKAGAGEGEDLRQLVIRFFPVNPETNQPIFDPATGERLVRTLVHQDITISPDTYTNSLLVLAPADHIDMMEMLVRMLDSIEPRTAKIEAYALRNADAQEMADLLDELFKPAQGAEEEGRQLVIAGEGAAGAGEGAAGSETEIAFAVDTRTNTLIAAGTPAQLKIVESLVYRLDDEPIDERVVRVLPLQYAESDEVADTLTSFFESESQLLEEAEEGAAAMRQLQRQVTIESGGETSNLLLLSYSPRLESQIVTMINELDRPPPQVMIQVLMAEVTLDDRFELGMEFALQDLLFSENAFLGANGTVQGDNFDFIGGTDLGAAGSGLGGVSFTVTGEDFNFLVRALQVDGRLEVLSRPSLLVQDNQEASIKVGERVPVVTELAVTGVGTVTPSVNYEDVGVNLEVTPIINPDGFVNLEIAPEISALGVSSVSIGSGVTLPVFTQRKAETSVTVKDGETIIIGGLITSRSSETENKVPILGDIPLLGLAFRATVRSESKTELLMVLTPHVIRNPEEARTISVQMRDQTGLMDDVRKSPLMQGLQVKPEDDQIGPAEPVPPPSAIPPDEMGPELDEFGPPTTSIEFGPSRDSIAVRN
jgi:type II secretion system protein D